MEFVCKTFPRESFPRFNYAYMKSVEFQNEYNSFNCTVTEEPFVSQQFIRVHLCRHRGESEFPMTINDMLPPSERRNVETGQIMKYRNIASYLKTQNKTNIAVSIFIVGSRAKREITKLGPTQFLFIVVANDDLTKEHLMKEFKRGEKQKITVAKKENISSELNTLLERYALAPLKQICETCYSMWQQECIYQMEDNVPTLSSENITHPGNKFRKVEINSGIKLISASCSQCSDAAIPRKDDQTTGKIATRMIRQVNGIADDQSQSSLSSTLFPHTIYTRLRSQVESKKIPNGIKYFDTPKESYNCKPLESNRGRKRKIPLHHNKPAIEINDLPGHPETEIYNGNRGEFHERLLERILALYGMSNVPEEDRPDVPEQNYNVSKELQDELFRRCSAIRRFGYRYRTFYIYAVTPQSLTDEAERHNVITSVLKTYGINKFKIAPCNDHITKLSSVGAKIEARSELAMRSRSVPRIKKGGTLGCFVNMNETERQCCLLSKHVCAGCTEIYDVANGKNELLGRIIPETTTHQDSSLDISAALMDKPTDEDGRKFMDTKGNRTIGKLYNYNGNADKICRSGQSVFFWGPTSSPGIGEITMPAVHVGLTSALIQVEDKLCGGGRAEAPFAKEGDSGAIVCVEDMNNDVHALGMVFGISNWDSAARGKHLTIPLSKGIQQLEQITGKTFTFC